MKQFIRFMTVMGALALGAPAQAGWTGCHVGVHLGMAMTNTTLGLDNATAFKGLPAGTLLELDNLGASDVMYGLGVGCDMQMHKFVVGAFADMEWHDAQWSLTTPALGNPLTAGFGFDRAWTIGGRAGFLWSDATLVYALLGWSQMDMSPAFITLGASSASASLGSTDGFVVGGGIETEIMKSVRLKLEYRYAMYDDIRVPLGLSAPLSGLGLNFEPDVHTVRLGISYAFTVPGVN